MFLIKNWVFFGLAFALWVLLIPQSSAQTISCSSDTAVGITVLRIMRAGLGWNDKGASSGVTKATVGDQTEGESGPIMGVERISRWKPARVVGMVTMMKTGIPTGTAGRVISRVRLLRIGSANHLQREHPKIGAFTFAGCETRLGPFTRLAKKWPSCTVYSVLLTRFGETASRKGHQA